MRSNLLLIGLVAISIGACAYAVVSVDRIAKRLAGLEQELRATSEIMAVAAQNHTVVQDAGIPALIADLDKRILQVERSRSEAMSETESPETDGARSAPTARSSPFIAYEDLSDFERLQAKPTDYCLRTPDGGLAVMSLDPPPPDPGADPSKLSLVLALFDSYLFQMQLQDNHIRSAVTSGQATQFESLDAANQHRADLVRDDFRARLHVEEVNGNYVVVDLAPFLASPDMSAVYEERKVMRDALGIQREQVVVIQDP